MQRVADGAIRFGRETSPLRWTVRSTFIVGVLVFRTATFYWLREAREAFSVVGGLPPFPEGPAQLHQL